MRDIVETPEEAAAEALPPLLVLEPVEAVLDAAGLGAGPIEATRIGDGHSNVTFLVRRGGERFVLRRPPRPPLPPSAHDVLREARLLGALAGTAVRVPRVLLAHEDEAALGVPFYVMDVVDGVVFHDELQPELDTPAERGRIGVELVDALAELHAVPPPEGLGGPTGYLERQLRRFAGLWELTRTRELPVVEEVHRRLEATVPESPPSTIVHGDYRLGNTMYAASAPARLLAILDWELATVGDPFADVGYLTATWTEPGAPSPLGHLTRHGAARVPDEGRARRPLRGGQRPPGRAAPLVPGARLLEGVDLPRGQLQALPRGDGRRSVLRDARHRRAGARGSGLGARLRRGVGEFPYCASRPWGAQSRCWR